MPLSSAIRLQVESALADKIPSALTPIARIVRPVSPTGLGELDQILRGGLPIGSVTEIVGREGAGHTSIGLSFIGQLTRSSKVCAWIDVSNSLDPASAAASGVDLRRLLWVRCGAYGNAPAAIPQSFALQERYLVPAPIKRGLHGGGFGSHPRSEVRGLSNAVGDLVGARAKPIGESSLPGPASQTKSNAVEVIVKTAQRNVTDKPWSRIEQALRATDLLLQGGGFSAIVLDMASLPAEVVSRIPLATWHRYRLAAERTQSSILLLTQHPCAKSSAELLLRLRATDVQSDETTVLSGLRPHVEVVRERFTESSGNVVPMRKPPQSANNACWKSRSAWAGRR